MATANATVKKVLNHLNQKISSVGGVTKTWKSSDGTQWYRVFSDGFIEQGGTGTGADVTTITLNTPFAKADYYASVTPVGNNSEGVMDAYTLFNKDTEKFSLYNWKIKTVGNVVWYACGY